MAATPAYVTDALNLADALAEATHVDEVFRQLMSWLDQFGASAVLVTGLPAPQHSRLEPYILLNGWPRAWHARYTEGNFYRHDPCVRRCLTEREPFLWSELPDPVLAARESRSVMREAAAFGLVDGLCIPLHDRFGFHAALTTAGPAFHLPPRARLMAQLLAHHAYSAGTRIGARQIGTAGVLTKREGEVLRWAGIGKMTWETAQVLGVSPSTVEKHLRAARDKLDAVTTAQQSLRRSGGT